MTYYEIKQNPGTVSLKEIPELDYNRFYEQTITLLKRPGNHCLNYFVHKSGNRIRFIILIAADDSHSIYAYSHLQNYNDLRVLKSLTAECLAMHPFERDIHEVFGIDFSGHPWPKPLRFPEDRYRNDILLRNYPFYSIESEEVHEVGVGPVHAGVIEPGHFRFICHGENVLHLEIQLGYQHRAVQKMIEAKSALLTKNLLAESAAGDSAVGNSLAFCQAIEELAGFKPDNALQRERIIALELERVAVHIGDTAALCGDVGYQLGQAACEALRTIVINTTQDWCGNRLGKGLIRPGGTNYPLSPEMADTVRKRINEVLRRYSRVAELVYNNSGIISRFENTGSVTKTQATLAGAVGMAARASGLCRDARASHPFQWYEKINYKPVIQETGDVLARGLLRKNEVEMSCNLIKAILSDHTPSQNKPDYDIKLNPGSLCISITEGWRGELCHAVVTDENGATELYKIIDPSVHNWMMLALAVRGQEISDFPLCNKSFNLSYCGHDL